MNPTEGTILTVMRKTAEEAEEIAKTRFAGDVAGMFAYLLDVAEQALAKTPDQLPTLKEAHVVDAGGYGFVTALEGMVAALNDHPVELLEICVAGEAVPGQIGQAADLCVQQPRHRRQPCVIPDRGRDHRPVSWLRRTLQRRGLGIRGLRLRLLPCLFRVHLIPS
jgi:hypothetical protein